MRENLENLIKRINRILKNKNCSIPDCSNIVKSILSSSEAETIFGGLFTEVSVFRFSKHLYPTRIGISELNGQKYISNLSFVYKGNIENGHRKTEMINSILSSLDYKNLLVNETPFDFSILKNIKF